MRRLRLALLVVLTLMSFACSKSGKGGTGSPDDMGSSEDGAGGNGNIPLAEPGSEMADVRFDYDSSGLSSDAQSTLRDNAKWMLDHPGKTVTLEGHCDERGTSEYNLALGERRAKAAYDFLRSSGVKKTQMSVISYGEELPLNPGHDEEAYSQNRRVHSSLK